MTLPLTSIKHALSIVDDWFDSHRTVITALDRLALEEVWNAYYAVAQASQSSPSLVITNLSTLYLETVRLQQFVKDHTSSEEPSVSISQLLTQLKQYLKQHGPDMHSVDEAAERIIAGHASHQMTNHSMPSSPTPRQQSLTDSVVSAEQLQRLLSGYASSSLSNEQLAHELILDPEFELQKAKPATALEQQIDTIARKAFFDQINDDILGGDYKTSVLPLLQDIKARLLSFVPAGSHGYRLVDETLDLELFEQQMDQGGGFDLGKVIRFVIDSMLQMAAPIRDDAIRQIDSVTEQGYQLRCILETLELMTLDLMNFRLKRLRPQLVPVAVDYEQAAFAKAMGLGTVGLAKTRQWLQLALERVVTKRTEKQDEMAALTTTMVVDEAYVGLLTATTAWNRLTCPETVLLDVDRIITYQNDLQEVVIVAALVLLGKNAGITQVKPFTKKIFALLKDTRQGGGGAATLDHLASEMERAISTEVSQQKKQWIRSIVAKTLSHSDPVYRLLEQRCASILRHQLATGDFVEPAVLLQSGLEPVQPQLKALCLRIKLFAEHNRRVYASWYHDLVSDLQQ